MKGQIEEKKQGVIKIALQDLLNTIEEIQNTVGCLEKKLEPVVHDADDSESETLETKDKKSVSISREIDLASSKVYGLNKRLRRLISRINI